MGSTGAKQEGQTWCRCLGKRKTEKRSPSRSRASTSNPNEDGPETLKKKNKVPNFGGGVGGPGGGVGGGGVCQLNDVQKMGKGT